MIATLPLLGAARQQEDPVAEVKAVLTDFHAAAAEGDVDRYLGYLSADCVLLGTDPAERWTRDDYEDLVRPAMSQGIKVVSVPLVQNVFVAESGGFAWFDETLEKPKYGEMRATGALRHDGERWKLVQFHITLPVPNEILPDVVKLTRAAKKR